MLRIGDKGDAVRNLQNLLISKGYSCGPAGADGDFGQSTYNAVIKFQGDHGLSQDGIVGPATWEALISGSFVKDSNNSYKHFTANRAELQRFIDAASKELATGFEEEYDPKACEGNNITKYGLWYDDGCFEDDGIHGKGAWCAAFVSYCANEAGILNKIIPKFCSVPRGVNWYYNHGRLAFRQNYTPKPGDIFFKFNGKRYSHTGIVVECSNGYVTTIEGNSGDKIASNRIPLTSNDVAAFGIN